MLEFIGKFHPLLVHLPIGFFILIGALELLAAFPRWKALASTNRASLILTLPACAGSILCGWLLASHGGYEGATLFWHRWLGTATGVAAVGLLILHWRGWITLYRIALAGTLGLLTVASHYGGALTHGSDFLAWPKPRIAAATLPTSAILDQSVYVVGIQPLFNKYCVGCHGPNKAKGGLRMDSAVALQKGGDSGPAIVPASSKLSLLGKRISLPLDIDEHMPPEAKPQPTAEQINTIQWWLDSGASFEKSVQDSKPSPQILTVLQSIAAAPAN